MIHRSIILSLLLSAFFFVDIASGASYFQVVTQHNNKETASTDGFFVTLVAKNPDDGTDTSYTGDYDITFGSNAKNSPDNWSPMIPSGIQSFDQGVAIIYGFILPNAATCTISASDGVISGASTTITVNPGTATQFKLSAPSTAMSGSAFSLSYLRACDLYGNIATDYQGSMILKYSGPGTTSTKNPVYPNPVYFDNGTAVLSSKITLYMVEETHIHIEKGAVKGDSGTITVSPGTPHYFEVTTQHNQTEEAGTPFSVTITARDLYG
ncbi:MAG: hypothetical protein AAB110_03260, partial [Candidatus Desantisbacteria bacterium]